MPEPDRATSVPGVWLVADQYGGSDDVIPFPTEIEALRYVNSDVTYQARFVPFGTSLRDLIWKTGTATDV